MSLRPKRTFNPRNIQLPIDIIMLILDWLVNRREILAVLWKAPFRKDFLIGREEALPAATTLNWRRFYLDIDERLALAESVAYCENCEGDCEAFLGVGCSG
ncbi:hypothetical protein NUU61_009283 [Penicillium alfredii]|uniref:Uncharacterized protein n=1 Tax=Penicillium alfredii TaxID=1506179 RepID=A0A9W9JWR6_9EURO|nr:uncharacterized protein NUU61_009283 [Penicillium alfredii]KAJ5084704.1 hypothetical protein NUU61_009283 [Penicillium alfredii]